MKRKHRPATPQKASRQPAMVAAVAIVVAVGIWVALGLKSIPEGAIGVLDSLVRGEQVLGPGLRFSLPGLESVAILDPYERTCVLPYMTPEGAKIDITFGLSLHLTTAGAEELIARAESPESRSRLDAAVDATVMDLLRGSAEDGGLPRFDNALANAVATVFSRYGRVEGVPRITFAEDSPVARAVHEAELEATVRELKQETGAKILIIGLDGADWQIAEPLIEQGLLPNLEALRARGAWGNIKALTPVLSPLLWTSVATGVRADRHGVLDFLIRDPATGQHVPVNSRFRKVRALWNLFSDAGLSSDVVAWWATWPAESVDGHIVSDRVAYSLFDFELPTGGVGATHPESYFDEIRADLIGDDVIRYEEVARFVDVTREEFDDGRARIADDRASAYQEPVNHLTKILAATQNYHRIGLDLLAKGQSDLTAVYYQAIDEVGHRFMHFAPPKADWVDLDDFQRYRRAVDEIYVYQDELIGELLEAADPESTVIILSDHGFLNKADRPQNETADIEGIPGRWHRTYGVFIITGPEIERQKLDTTSLLDITPTVLYLAGLPVPEDTDGRVVAEAFAPAFRERFPETRVATYEVTPFRIDAAYRSDAVAEAEAEIVENLRSLGYIGGESTEIDGGSGTGAGGSGSDAVGSETVTGLTNLAAVLLASNDLEGAERETMRALEIVPGYAVALRQLFSIRVAQDRLDEAVEIGETLLDDTDEQDTYVAARIANTYFRAGRTDEGVDRFKRRIEDGQWELGAPLARLLFDSGDVESADRVARTVLQRDARDQEAMVTAFRVARSRGDLSTLEPILEEALELNPRSVMHLNWLAIVHESRGDMKRAESLLLRALDANPDHGGSMANLGAFYGRHGRNDEAIVLLERAVRINPGNLDARINLGSSLARSGRLMEAIAQFERAVDGGRNTPELCNAVARAYGQAGDLSSAADWLRRSLEVDPDQPQARATLAQIEQRL